MIAKTRKELREARLAALKILDNPEYENLTTHQLDAAAIRIIEACDTAQGWTMVPVIQTGEMLKSISICTNHTDEETIDNYTAMLKAVRED